MNFSLSTILRILSITLTLIVMGIITHFVAQHDLEDTYYLIILINLSLIASFLQSYTFNFFMKKVTENESYQKNLVFIGSVVYFEVNKIDYTIQKTEQNNTFAYHINWQKNDTNTEQLRAIFCSMCIHNFKGVTPTKNIRRLIQNDWEYNVPSNLTVKQKQILWKKQSKELQDTYKKNRKVLKQILALIEKNLETDELKKQINEIICF